MRKNSLFLLLALLTMPQALATPKSTQLALARKQHDDVRSLWNTPGSLSVHEHQVFGDLRHA